jgi:hypothetical protein
MMTGSDVTQGVPQSMTMGELKTWLGQLSAPNGLEVPSGLPPQLGELASAINLQALDSWYPTIKETVKLTGLSVEAGSVADLHLKGKFFDTLELTLYFVCGKRVPAETDPVVGVVASLSMAGMERFGFLSEVLKALSINFEIRMVEGAVLRRLFAAARFQLAKDRTVTITADLDFEAQAKSYEFIATSSVSISVADVLGALGFSEAQSLTFLPVFTGIAVRYDILGPGKHQIITYPTGVEEGTIAWAVVVVPRDGVGHGGRVVALALGLGLDWSLADVPLVGSQIPRDVASLRGVDVVAVSATDLSDTQQWELQGLLQGALRSSGMSGVVLPKQVWSSTVSVGVTVLVGGKAYPVLAPLTKSKDEGVGDLGGEGGGLVGADAVVVGGGVPLGGVVWVGVDKAVGPLRLQRLGVACTKGVVWLLLDGELVLAGITVRALGLGLGVELRAPYHPHPTLDGVGVAYANVPVEIAGAVMRRDPPQGYDLLLSGGVIVTTPAIAIAAAGAYAHRSDGGVSLYVFGQVEGLRVGAPPLELVGLSGGFGYNSAVRVPAVEQVEQFPLVAGGTAFPVDQGPAAVFEALAEVITPSAGEIWLAAGVHVVCFEFVDVKALLVLQAGREFTLTLLGLARAQFPLKGTAYAKGTLQIRAMYAASSGEISVAGQLTRDSYLLHPDCHLQGGFAFCAWPSSPHQGESHQGDFVVTLGGYHPDYRRPSHYPQVPRIGFCWSLSGELSVRGECYGALTPAAFMLGVGLNVDFHASVVHAWLDAHVDAMIQWSPFSFEVDVGVRAGVELDIPFHPRVEAGVDVTVWGPPTGGIATFHLPIIGAVSTRFGPGPPSTQPWLPWKEFHDTSLSGRGVDLMPVTGVLPDHSTAKVAPVDDGGARSRESSRPWRVTPAGFGFTAQTPVPISQAQSTGPDGVVVLHCAGAAPGPFPIRPMHRDGVTAPLTLTVTTASGTVVDIQDPDAGWSAEYGHRDLPRSLWGKPLDEPGARPESTDELVGGMATALHVTVPVPRKGSTPGPIPEEVLDTKTLSPRPRYDLDPAAGPDGPVPRRTDTARGEMATGLASPAAVAAREAVCAVLRGWGLAPPQPVAGSLTDTADRVFSYLPVEPLTSASLTPRQRSVEASP